MSAAQMYSVVRAAATGAVSLRSNGGGRGPASGRGKATGMTTGGGKGEGRGWSASTDERSGPWSYRSGSTTTHSIDLPVNHLQVVQYVERQMASFALMVGVWEGKGEWCVVRNRRVEGCRGVRPMERSK